jgi:tRNA A-37 threonylcarbamoyl transferase component Bud32
VEVTVGNVLLGKYRVDEVLGSGGMGKVLRAWHVYLQQPVAIKMLLQHVLEDRATVERFLREAQATSKLRSEHIARVTDVSSLPDGTPMLVMEYLDGSDLNQILRAHGPQAPSIVVDLMLQACEGIAEAHAIGIVHRDIKPSNFFVTRRIDGTQLLKILDFGISKAPVTNNMELTGTQTVVGTPTYMAPEQMKNARSADARSDIWSMGVVLYQLMEGRPPYVGQSYAELVLKVGTEPVPPMSVKVPAGLYETILRCLEKEPNKRVQSVAELAKMIAPFASDPIGGAFAADRVARIVAARMSAPSMRSRTDGGSPFPAPLSPSSHGSVSHGSGQVTYQTRGPRAWIVAGAAALVIVAGAGGYILSDTLRGASSGQAATTAHDEHKVQLEATTSGSAAAEPAAAGSAAVATVTVDAGVPVAADAAVAAVAVDAATVPVATTSTATTTTKPTTRPTTTRPSTGGTATHPTTAATTTRPTTTTTKHPSKDDDGLFDSRR